MPLTLRVLSQWWARLRSSHRRIRRGAAPRRRGRPSRCCRRRSRDEREPQEPSKDQAPKSGLSSCRDPPPVGGHRSGGQALPGWDPALLVSLVGWVCSGRAQNEAKKAAATLTVSSLGAPSSGPLKSWLVVARGASAHSNWLGTSAGSISTRPAPSGSPTSAWAAGVGGERRAQIGWFGTKNHKAPGGGSE